jgi:hypothetical protein
MLHEIRVKVYRNVAAYFHYAEDSVQIEAVAALSQRKAPHFGCG